MAKISIHFQTRHRNKLICKFLKLYCSQRIDSGQTANVIVTVGITPTAQPGARDLITFTAYGNNGNVGQNISLHTNITHDKLWMDAC